MNILRIKPLHPNFKLPTRGSRQAGGYDLYMPEEGWVFQNGPTFVPLGFCAAIPEGHIALLLPRSGVGAKQGLELNNTVGVIDADYRGEWMAAMKLKNQASLTWQAGERLLQFLIVPAVNVPLAMVDTLDETGRADGGFGSTGT